MVTSHMNRHHSGALPAPVARATSCARDNRAPTSPAPLITPAECTLTKNTAITHAQCALTKSYDLKSRRFRTYRKNRGRGTPDPRFRYNGFASGSGLLHLCEMNPMPLQAPAKPHTFDSSRYHRLTAEQLIRIYRTMFLSRRLDDREVQLKRQHKIYFQISGAGHEAVLAAAGEVLRPGYDWFFPYYRDRALCLRLGVTPYEMLLQSVGAKDDPASGGRQMPSHWGHAKLNIVSSSSPTGTQFVQAVGCAEGGRFLHPESDEITLVASGEGATSEGEFWESLNAACLRRLPVLFLIEDNGYAISVPVESQTAGANISRLVSGFPDLFQQEVDGCDFLASYEALQAAGAYCRDGNGPALVHAHVIRPYSHSLSDDERLYKTAAERQSEQARDPLVSFPKLLLEEGVLDENALRRITLEVDREVHDAAQEA